MISVAVIGKYQIGKSSFVNALLNSKKTKTGNGSATTHANHRYVFSPFIEIYDTPGINANVQDDKTADNAIDTVDFIIFIHENKMLDSNSIEVIRDLTCKGKPLLFLLNCNDFSIWDPEDKQNILIAQNIESQLISSGLSNNFLTPNNRIVHTVNILWALFALDLLENDNHKINKIHKYAKLMLELSEEVIENENTLRDIMMQKSNFPVIRDMIEDLPYRQLLDAVANPQKEINRFIALFYDIIAKSKFVQIS